MCMCMSSGSPPASCAFHASRAQVNSVCVYVCMHVCMHVYIYISLCEYFADLLSFASVPAESPTLRQLVSGLLMPAGIRYTAYVYNYTTYYSCISFFDLISWASVPAESPTLRQLVSGLSMPAGSRYIFYICMHVYMCVCIYMHVCMYIRLLVSLFL